MSSQISYRNLDLELFEYKVVDAIEQFRVRVSSSPAGEQRIRDAEQVLIPQDLRRRLEMLEKRNLQKKEIASIGEDLAELLFPPKSRSLLTGSLHRLQEGESLRIRLKPDSHELADLPWEFAYLPLSDAIPDKGDLRNFMALDRRISLVRYELVGQPLGSLDEVTDYPLRVVALFANPDDPRYARLKLDLETRHIREALDDLESVVPEYYPNAKLADLQEALRQTADVFHFAGHGEFEIQPGPDGSSTQGFLILVGEDQKGVRFPAEKLALSLRSRGIRLAVLGACESGRFDHKNAWTGVVQALVRAEIPAVLGMQYEILDANAIMFSERFYAALADGLPIDAAVVDGRIAVALQNQKANESDWGVPVLYLRGEDGVIFPRPGVASQKNTWRDVQTRSEQQTERFLRAVQGSAERPGSFIQDTHTRREIVEKELGQFLESDRSALVLLGSSGIGKTNSLCQWTLDLMHSGHAVFYYDFTGSISAEIERELTYDLSLTGPDALLDGLHQIGELAASEDRQFVIIFDAINQFNGHDNASPAALLGRIDELVGRLPDKNVRIVLSCSTPGWKSLVRKDATNLFWNRYFVSQEETPFVELDLFSKDQLQAAYELHSEFFGLEAPLADLPVRLTEKLRYPLLMRMFAEAYQNQGGDITQDSLSLEIIERYYGERVRRTKDRVFSQDLAAEMLHQRRSALLIDVLAQNANLRTEILANDPESSYYRLIDGGVLSEATGDLRIGDVVRFTYPRVGAYALARRLLGTAGGGGGSIAELVREHQGFPLVWDTGRTMLMLGRDRSEFVELGSSTEVELRELAVEGLAELGAEEPQSAVDLIKELAGTDSSEARQTALKAAYRIGPGAQEVFLWAAGTNDTALRQTAKDVAYLIWRTDPESTYDLLQKLADQIGIGVAVDPRKRRILEFMADLSITIYINHPEREDVIRQTDQLWYEVLKNRLHIDLLNTDVVGPGFQKLLLQVVRNVFSQKILEPIPGMDLADGGSIFSLSGEEKQPFRNAIQLLSPDAKLDSAQVDLIALFNSDRIAFNVVAAMVLAIHAYQSFESSEPLLRDLFDQLDTKGKSWELAAFSLLLPSTPPAWLDFLEELTNRVLKEHPGSFEQGTGYLLPQLDLRLLPLGLAYGKRGGKAPFFETLIREGIERNNRRQVSHVFAGLGPVGFYYPEVVFETLKAAIPDFQDPEILDELIEPLAMMRTLHFDAVDTFLSQVNVDEDYQRRVSAAADVELVRPYIFLLGFFNNAVHQALFYPRMRRRILMASLESLAEASSSEQFISEITPIPLNMLLESDCRLINWTLPDDPTDDQIRSENVDNDA